jgi:hypothetical protein
VNSPLSPSRSLTRRELVWHVCDQLATQNDKPSLSKVRATHRGGSDTDVQADIQAWYACLFQKHSEEAAGLGVPDEVGQLMRALWASALASAQGHLEQERRTLADARETIDLEKQVVLEQHHALQGQWDALNRANQEQTLLLGLSNERLQQTLAQNAGLQAEQGVQNQRISNVMQDLSLMELRHAETVHQLSQQHTTILEHMATEHRSRLMEFESAQTLQEQRSRGVEKHMLLQIEEARLQTQEWKSKAEHERGEGQIRQDTLNAQLQQARLQNAHARGQQESLQEQVQTLEKQKELLVRELAQCQAQWQHAPASAFVVIPGSVAPVGNAVSVKSAANILPVPAQDASSTAQKEMNPDGDDK